MEKLLVWIGLFLGGWLGWALGAVFSIAAALILSVVGTGLGLYLARKIAREYF